VSARDEILARIATALADRPRPAPVTRDYRQAAEVPDLLGLLAERIADYRAEVHTCAGPDAPALLAGLVGDRRVGVPAGFPPGLLAAVRHPVPDEPPLTVEQLDALDGAVVGCAVAVAETGTVVLDHGPGQGRRVLTLVPDRLLVVVRADQVVAGVPQAVARLAGRPTQTWISGPSATSDIELSRVEGVHGPRTLQVLLVHGARLG